MSKVKKLNAPIHWLGSKGRQTKNLLSIFGEVERKCYCEPFGGSGAVFCAKDPEEYEVYNDLNGCLTNMFRQLRRPETVKLFREMAVNSPWCRGFWNDYKKLCLAFMKGDVEEQDKMIQEVGYTSHPRETVWAFAFFYCQNLGFGGKFLSAFGGGEKKNNVGKSWQNRLLGLDWYQDRFKNVLVEELDCFACIKKYDKETTLFYVDPPYDVDCSKDYETGWTRNHSEQLVETLCNIEGKAVVSCYANETYARLADAGYKRKDFEAAMSVCRTKREPRIETVYYRI